MSYTSPYPPWWKLFVPFAVIYLIWGSTYLGIRYAVETLPPLVMMRTGHLVAGGIGWTLAGEPRSVRSVVAMAVIVTAVAMIVTTAQGRGVEQAKL